MTTTAPESPYSIFKAWETQLKDAVKSDNLELVKELASQNPDLYDTFSACLLTAISKCNCEIASVLLKNGARMPNDSMWLVKLIERDDKKEVFHVIFQKAVKLIGTLIQNGISLEYLLSMYYKIQFNKRCDDNNAIMEVLIEGLFERINYPIDYIVKTFVDSTSEMEIFWLVDCLTSRSGGRIQLHHFADYIDITKINKSKMVHEEDTEMESIDETDTELNTNSDTDTELNTESETETDTEQDPTKRIKQVIELYTGQEKLQEFLDLLYYSGSYISGSMLLTLDANADLDIFTTSKRTHEIVDFIYRLGFMEEPEYDTEDYDYLGLDIFSEKKYYKGRLTIDLIVCHDPLRIISSFDLTCCMNWFNGKEIYYLDTIAETDNALFTKYPIKNKPITPTPNGAQISLYNLASKKTYKMEYRIAKYEKRGFEIIKVHSQSLFNPEIMYNIISKNALVNLKG